MGQISLPRGGSGTGSGTPAGPVNSIQFNNAGAFGGDVDFTWNKVNNTLTLGILAIPATIRPPIANAANGASLTIAASDGVGADKNGGTLNLNAGNATGAGTPGSIKLSTQLGVQTSNGNGLTDFRADNDGYAIASVSNLFGSGNPVAVFYANGGISGGAINAFGSAENLSLLMNNAPAAAGGFTQYFNFYTLFSSTVGDVVVLYDDSGNVVNSFGEGNIGGMYQTPVSGFVITITDNIKFLTIEPAGLLATGTINLPAVPFNGQEIEVSSTQTVTALTVSGNGHTIKNAPVTIAAGGGFGYRYRLSNTTWYRRY